MFGATCKVCDLIMGTSQTTSVVDHVMNCLIQIMIVNHKDWFQV